MIIEIDTDKPVTEVDAAILLALLGHCEHVTHDDDEECVS